MVFLTMVSPSGYYSLSIYLMTNRQWRLWNSLVAGYDGHLVMMCAFTLQPFMPKTGTRRSVMKVVRRGRCTLLEHHLSAIRLGMSGFAADVRVHLALSGHRVP
ncbi:hypothetical protein Mapa_000485 [Marchantia paleacea]|nr:hypothetical protein Mapa_000485 [Marchantia paleacea]